MEAFFSIHRSATEFPPCVQLNDTDVVAPDDPILISRWWWAPREDNSSGVSSTSSNVGGRRRWGCREMKVQSVLAQYYRGIWILAECSKL